MGSAKLVTAIQFLDLHRRPSEYLGILPQFPITLCEKNVLVDMVVVDFPLDFNMLLGHNYIYSINVVEYTLFRVMCFPHNERILTID
jgi:hypothetical protein